MEQLVGGSDSWLYRISTHHGKYAVDFQTFLKGEMTNPGTTADDADAHFEPCFVLLRTVFDSRVTGDIQELCNKVGSRCCCCPELACKYYIQTDQEDSLKQWPLHQLSLALAVMLIPLWALAQA